MSHTAPTPVAPKVTLTPQLIINVIGFAVTEFVALGVFNNGFAQQILAIAGIVIPAAVSIAQALHLGPIHAAQVAAAAQVPAAPVIPVKRTRS